MERDMEVVRSILKQVEKAEDHQRGEDIAEDLDLDVDKTLYHIQIMVEGDLLHAKVRASTSTGQIHGAIVHRLAWDGHEFLSAVRSPDIWQDAQNAFAEKSLGMTIDLVRSVAKSYAEKKLGLKD